MSRVLSAKDFPALTKWILDTGKEVMSERGMTTEVVNANLIIRNPRNRVDTSRIRKMNLAFAFAEWLYMMTGVDDLPSFTTFIKGYDAYSTDGKKLDGAYGPRIYESLTNLVATLKKNPSSRRAVLAIYNNEDLNGGGGKNTPCTLTYNFVVRDGLLSMICNMRSNDVYFGLTNDLVVNTMLQEWVALATGNELGEYYHNAASLHVYHDSDAMKLLSDEGRWPHIMPAMDPSLADYEELEKLSLIYQDAWKHPYPDMMDRVNGLKSQYAKDIANVGLCFNWRRHEWGKICYNEISDHTLRRVMLPWISVKDMEGAFTA